MVSAYRTTWIFFHFDLAKIHGKRVHDQETINKEIAGTKNILKRLDRLYSAENAGDAPQDARFPAAWHRPRRGRFIEKAPVAGAFPRNHGQGLAVKPEYPRVGKWLSR